MDALDGNYIISPCVGGPWVYLREPLRGDINTVTLLDTLMPLLPTRPTIASAGDVRCVELDSLAIVWGWVSSWQSLGLVWFVRVAY